MSELRQDPVSGEWVFFASNRRRRPYDFTMRKIVPKEPGKACAFCPGHEAETTETIFQNRPGKDWSIRVFSNMYPAVHREAPDFAADDFYRNVPGLGLHEVLVDTPDHEGRLHDFTMAHFQEVLEVLQTRCRAIRGAEEVAYVQVFKNCGPDAGASIAHSHWQLLGTPVLGKVQADQQARSLEYLEKTGHCMVCDMLQKEQRDGRRIIAENAGFLAFAPYASRSSFEVWVAAKTHVASFADFEAEQRRALGDLLLPILKCIPKLRDGVGYNICFQDAPKGAAYEDTFHWYCRLLPRIGAPAGFEYGTGNRINPVLPEFAAAKYRELRAEP